MTPGPAVPELSIFFPCHDEEENAGRMIDDSLRVGELVARRFEVIVVDDGSTDGTREITGERARGDQRVRVVRHPQRQGYGAALQSGFKAAKYDLVFYTDGDCQFDLDELPSAIDAIADADVVSAYRRRRRDPWMRKLNSATYGLALRCSLGLRVRDVNCAFKLYRRKVLQAIEMTSKGALIDAEMLLQAQRAGFRIVQPPVTHRPRTAGRQSGAQPGVILRAMRELLAFCWRMRKCR